MLDLLILAASAFIVTISSISDTIPHDMEFKKLLKNHILLILKDNNTNKSVLELLIFITYFNMIINFFVFRYNISLLPNVIEQAVKDSNEYLASKNRPPLSSDVVNLIETQVLSIKEPEHKIRTLVGNINMILLKKNIIVFSFYCLVLGSWLGSREYRIDYLYIILVISIIYQIYFRILLG